VTWDPFLSELELQFAAQEQAERRLAATETERVRIAELALTDRLSALAEVRAAVALWVAGAAPVRGRLVLAGPDWAAIEDEASALSLVAVGAIVRIDLPPVTIADSVREISAPRPLRARMGLAWMLRELGRRRVGVRVWDVDGNIVTGTIDRVGTDHLDLAVHDAGQSRREAVGDIRVVPLVRLARVVGDLDL
jgi:hypothetical protein